MRRPPSPLRSPPGKLCIRRLEELVRVWPLLPDDAAGPDRRRVVQDGGARAAAAAARPGERGALCQGGGRDCEGGGCFSCAAVTCR